MHIACARGKSHATVHKKLVIAPVILIDELFALFEGNFQGNEVEEEVRSQLCDKRFCAMELN
jgi:hypothetical protein